MWNNDNLINELKDNGINAENICIIKNGVECTGIRIINPEYPELCPVIYYSQDETLEEIIRRTMEVAGQEYPAFNANLLKDPDYLLSNVTLAVQRIGGGNNYIHRNLLNVELIMKVLIDDRNGDCYGAVKITPEFLFSVGLDEEKMWKAAMNNSRSRFSIRSMAEILGMPEDITPVPFSVCTTETGNDGAAALAFPEVFRGYCEENSLERVFIIPSSIQELLILPASYMKAEELAAMVDSVNNSEVDPILQLEPVCYVYDSSDDTIRIAAVA